MEKIKVNMSPNPLDVQTIHASQNDGEARQWEFELHNNGELIDTSDVKEQLVFKAYKGGTEQILPENTSTPTTSPFIGDIRYPQGLLTDQEFTYRESPTEEDGLAKITDIKGNTIVWNQLIQNGNFADTSIWSAESGATLSISNNIATISSTTANNGIRQYFPIPLTVGHKYLIKAEFNVPTEYRCVIGTAANQGVQTDKLISTANTWTEVSGIETCTVATTSFYCFVKGTTYENVKIRNVMCIDITQMGLDVTNPSDFTSLFPLSYYSYNQGSLLSFNGNGIKTVGKNLFNGYLENTRTSAGYYIRESSASVDQPAPIKLSKGTYTFSIKSNVQGRAQLQFYNGGNTPNDIISSPLFTINVGTTTLAFTVEKDVDYIRMYGNFAGTLSDVQIEFGNQASNYEPYTESVLSLPISTYFPSGMKSAGNVYDELTESKAITRIGAVDLGSLTWLYRESGSVLAPYFYALFSEIKSQGNPARNKANIICSKYQTVARNETDFVDKTICTDGSPTVLTQIQIKDSSYTDTTAFKNSLQGQYLYYEMVTETETSFSTASLVTENAEIPLSNEDGVLIGKCTEELSAEPGFHDAKIKLADADGECYSNKIQLHVERSPQ